MLSSLASKALLLPELCPASVSSSIPYKSLSFLLSSINLSYSGLLAISLIAANSIIYWLYMIILFSDCFSIAGTGFLIPSL
jgi:hypothetical protein